MSQGDGASLASMAADASVKGAFPIGATGALYLGFTLNDWVAITAISYTVFQTGVLLHATFTKWKAKRNGGK